MILDIEAFGSGIGLVMIGWASGLVVSYAFNLMRVLPNIPKIGK
jgi:hypothetical protein